jgi:hypothetical protein
MTFTSDPTTTRKLGPIAEGALQALEACVSRSQVDNVAADTNRKALVELARYFDCYDGNSRAAKEDLAREVADTYWQVRTPSLPEQAAATVDAIDALLAEGPEGPQLPEAPEAPAEPEADTVVVPSLVELVNQGMTADEARAARRALLGNGTDAPKAPKVRAAWMPRYAEAREAAKAKLRPACYPVPTDALARAAYVRNVQLTVPGATCAQSLEVAAWVDGLPVTRQVWARTWAEVAEQLAAEQANAEADAAE